MRAAASVDFVQIAVYPPEHLRSQANLWRELEALFPVKFIPGSGDATAVAAIVFTGSPEEGPAFLSPDCVALVLPPHSDSRGASRRRTVAFAPSDAVPRSFRGRRFVESSAYGAPVGDRRPDPGGEALAFLDEMPVWIRNRRAESGQWVYWSALPLPALSDADALVEHANRDRFLALLPLLAFLRSVTAGRSWQSTSPRACFVFDDPNLRRGRYGCLDFRRLARHALEHGYHAAIATIPLDAARTSREVAAIFRESAAQLSLAIHGNDHLAQEFSRLRPGYTPLIALAQGRRRMDSLARRLDIPVGHIAEPPYGAISSQFFPALVRLGYEAVLLTVRQYLECNQAAERPAGFGLAAVECLPEGLTMIPRIPASDGWETEAALAAFLGQPIVIAGHHYDAYENLSFLARLTATVNDMAPVRWSNLQTISRSRYLYRREGRHLHVRLGGRHVVVDVPDGVDTMHVERPWVAGDATEPLLWQVAGGQSQTSVSAEPGMPAAQIPVAGAAAVDIVSPAPGWVDPMSVPDPPDRIWPGVRRMFTEARDRTFPFRRRFIARRTGHTNE